MKIETKFNVGDRVWWTGHGSDGPFMVRGLKVDVWGDGGLRVQYVVDVEKNRSEERHADYCVATREECLRVRLAEAEERIAGLRAELANVEVKA